MRVSGETSYCAMMSLRHSAVRKGRGMLVCLWYGAKPRWVGVRDGQPLVRKRKFSVEHRGKLVVTGGASYCG